LVALLVAFLSWLVFGALRHTLARRLTLKQLFCLERLFQFGRPFRVAVVLC
jgi:hypothetical protein